MLNNKNLYIFDLDGTIVNSKSHIVDAVIDTGREFFLPEIQKEEVEDKIGLSAERLFPDILDGYLLTKLVTKFRIHLSKKQFSPDDLFPGAFTLLNYLSKSGIKLRMATNKPKDLALLCLDGVGIRDLFDDLYTASTYSLKPNPEMILAATESSDPNQTVMIGDRVEDSLAARDAGVAFCGVSPKLLDKTVDYFPREFYLFKSIENLYLEVAKGEIF